MSDRYQIEKFRGEKKMKEKIFTLFAAALLLLSIFSVAYVPAARGTSMPEQYGALSAPLPELEFRDSLEESGDLEGISGTSRYMNIIAIGAEPDTGNPWTVPVIDDFLGGWYLLDFECVLQGEHCNIWIGLSTDVWPGGYVDHFVDNPGFDDDEWYFAYPWSSTGFPDGPGPGHYDVIYGEYLTYVLDQFDNNIWEKDTEFFGMYADRPGPEDDYKIQILIFNIRDYLFWIPEIAPWFIEGYFWSYASNLNDANIIHIDTWQWEYRLGPQPLHPTHAYEYEGTFAHEFQHLIHYDLDSNELSWVNEGCSTLAEYICGYGFSPGHISEYLIWHWDTSLTIWESYLSNYGAVFLWTFYIYEHYHEGIGPGTLIWDITHEQANGIEGYNNVLQAHGIKKTFDEIYEDWTIANYLDDTSFKKGIYGYYDLDIPSEDTLGQLGWQWSIPLSVWIWGYQIDWYPVGGYMYARLPYIAQYLEFYGGAPELKVYFDGDDYCGVPAYSGMYEWYSDGTSFSWFRLGQTFSIPATGATLKFWSNYEIEEDWDYGYVEVYDVDDDQWYTLPGLTTVSTLPNPQDNPNCPAEFEPTTYESAGTWNAFTGSSAGWYQETMDLTPFADHTIELYFTYWTDPYTLELGWYIDDIEIPEIGFFDDVESGADGWTGTGWYITTGVVPNDFEVNFIQTTNFNIKGGKGTSHHISHMQLNDDTEEGQQLLKVIDTMKVQSGPAVMIVANQPGYEHTFATFWFFIADIQPFLGPH